MKVKIIFCILCFFILNNFTSNLSSKNSSGSNKENKVLDFIPSLSSNEKIFEFSVPKIQSIQQMSSYGNHGAAALADLDNDGKAELIMSRIDNNYMDYVWGSKKSENKTHKWIEEKGFYDIISIMSLDGNEKKVDAFNSNKFEIYGDRYSCIQASHLVTGDLNGDKIDDLAIGCSGYDARPWPGDEQFILLSEGNFKFKIKKISRRKIFAHGIVLFDVDSDNDLDILYTSGPETKIFVSYNDGIGNFSEPKIFMHNTPVSTLAAIDINNDGFDDLIIGGNENSSYKPFKTTIFWNNGTGQFKSSNKSYLPEVKAFPKPMNFIADDKYLYITRTSSKHKDAYVQRIDKDTLEEVGAFKRNGRHAAQSIRVNLLKEGVYEFGGLLSEVSVSFTTNDERFK